MAMMLSVRCAVPGLTSAAALTPDSCALRPRIAKPGGSANGRPSKGAGPSRCRAASATTKLHASCSALLRQWRAALDRVRAYDALEMLGEIAPDAGPSCTWSELARQTRYDDLLPAPTACWSKRPEQRGLSLEQLPTAPCPTSAWTRARLSLTPGPRSLKRAWTTTSSPCCATAPASRSRHCLLNAGDDARPPPRPRSLRRTRKLAKTVASAQPAGSKAMSSAWAVDEFIPLSPTIRCCAPAGRWSGACSMRDHRVPPSASARRASWTDCRTTPSHSRRRTRGHPASAGDRGASPCAGRRMGVMLADTSWCNLRPIDARDLHARRSAALTAGARPLGRPRRSRTPACSA